jgi:hypothetical protein
LNVHLQLENRAKLELKRAVRQHRPTKLYTEAARTACPQYQAGVRPAAGGQTRRLEIILLNQKKLGQSVEQAENHKKARAGGGLKTTLEINQYE